MSAADSTLTPAEAAAADDAAAVGAAPPRRRLFRKYALLFVALVGAALLITSGFDFWFSYQESKAALIRIQQEKADAAARRIQEFVDEIERQIGWTTHAQWAAGPLDQRRQDYFRLLRQVPPITELTQLDGRGREQLKVSRLSIDVIGSEADLSLNPAFTQARAKHAWFSPVYFRKDSEPYMTLALANDGKNAGVTVAEINLKLIQDVITALKIGQGGYAYVVDGHGRLIAHPDISLVLRDTDLSTLPQIAAALLPAAVATRPGQRPPNAADAVSVATSIGGRKVLTAHAAIDPLGWLVFVEVPLGEAFAPLYGAAARTGLLLVFGLIAATLVALVLARRMTGPIRAIAEGAERLGRGELDRRLDIHTGDELEALAQQFNRMAGDLQKSYAELEQRVIDRTAELSEALDQQTATAEVLGVINSSPGDLAPVFDAILEKAHSLCGAAHGVLVLRDGENFRAVGVRGLPEGFAERLRRGFPGAGNPVAVPLLSGAPFVLLADLSRIDHPLTHAGASAGLRTMIAVALRKDGALLGWIVAARREIRAFSDKEIALLQNFAAQAVIAMENARLITETREALEQQTATAEVLGVINASPGDLAPVFDAMLEKAHSLCGVTMGALEIWDGVRIRAVATRGLPTRFAGLVREGYEPLPSDPHWALVHGERFLHIANLAEVDDPTAREAVAIVGVGTFLAVALRKDDVLLGRIIAARQEVRPFAEKEIALLQNFAAQAVIAMENARLITETREALEQQTATAEVLGVINASPGDLAPVFDAMLEKAMRLCEAAFGMLMTYDGEAFGATAHRGLPMSFAEYIKANPTGWRGAHMRLTEGAPLVHILDAKDDAAYQSLPSRRALVDLGGARSIVLVPLRREEQLLGSFAIYRQEVRPFTGKQIALLQTFAAQAVIAMENARLITETREALEQQTATAEVLGVINSSPGDLVPVFDAMLEKAMRLCEAAFGQLAVYEHGRFRTSATRGMPAAFVEYRRDNPPDYGPGTQPARLLAGERVIHVPDMMAEEIYQTGDPNRRALVDLGGVRSSLMVPLLRDEAVLGFINFYRREVRPFSEKQIALLQNFAGQAVIAMENARLLDELRGRTRDLQESLEYQTATSDVLKVISQSTFDLGPVLHTVVETALRICGADMGGINLLQPDGTLRALAGKGFPKAYLEFLGDHSPPVDRGSLAGRTLLDSKVVHIPDVAADREFTWDEAAHIGGFRTMLGVPLLREDKSIGVLVVMRSRVEPFSDKQLGLFRTFADQAVIAIENARLLHALRERTDELTHSVEELKALGEVGQAVSSTLDLDAVLSTILNRSVGLTGSDAGAIFRYRRAVRSFRLFEAVGWDEGLVAEIRQLNIAEEVTAIGEATARRTPVQIADLEQRASNPLRDINLAAGYHSVLIVPLNGADRIFGAIVLQRRAAGEFPETTVRLMQTLAAQSVLAIQNARLFNEIAEKSEQLAEASRHKSQFLANMSHELRTPMNAILGYTELMVDGIYGELTPRAAGVLERVQNNGRHLLALINDVLDLAKIEAGQLALTLEDYMLADVVHSVVSATEGLAHTKGLKFTADMAPGLPTGHGDARRLSQVLLNLVGNAVKFTDAGEVALQAAAENGHFVLTVRDTGPGIAAADHGKIFEEFQQVDSSDTRKKGGTGLGLAISKRMVEMQGGTISVVSELGKGATFRVSLPVRVESVADEMADEMMGGMTKRILVIEDTEDNRQIVSDLLQSVGYELIEAVDGLEGVVTAEREQPDLILMDIQLPGIDGYEATRRIRAIPALAKVPIIAVTSYALSGDEAKTRAAGCDGYVAKPFSPRQLLAKIREFLP